MIPSNPQLVELLRNWDGDAVIRDESRLKRFGEIFTPTELVQEMLDNVEMCRDRLLCGVEELRHIVTRNIVWADSLTYNFEFGSDDSASPPSKP